MELSREKLNEMWKGLVFNCVQNQRDKFERIPVNCVSWIPSDLYARFKYVCSYGGDLNKVHIEINFHLHYLVGGKKNIGNITIRIRPKHSWISIRLKEEDIDYLISLFEIDTDDIHRMYEADRAKLLANEKLNYNEVVTIIKKEE